MIITADLAHRLISDLELALAYYNKIFRCISGPPKWLTHNLRQAFEEVETADGTAFLRYNPDWEIPVNLTAKSPIPVTNISYHVRLWIERT